MKKLVFVILLLIFFSGCTFFCPYIKDKKLTDGKEELLEGVRDSAGKGLTTVWTFSESNKLFFIFSILAVAGAVIGAVTHLRVGWVVCGINAGAAISLLLASIFVEALMRYITVIGFVLIILMIVGLAFLALKLYAVAKESFAYGEGLKTRVDSDELEKHDGVVRNIQSTSVKKMIKWIREH